MEMEHRLSAYTSLWQLDVDDKETDIKLSRYLLSSARPETKPELAQMDKFHNTPSVILATLPRSKMLNY